MTDIYAKRLGNEFETLEGHIKQCLDVSLLDEYNYMRVEIEKNIDYISLKNGYSKRFREILKTWMLKDCIIYHDYGKKTKTFQDKIKTESNDRVNHSTVSAVLWMNDLDLTLYKEVGKAEDIEGYKHFCKWVYLVSCIINTHHSRRIDPSRILGFEKTLYVLHEDKLIKDEGISLDNMDKILMGWIYLGENTLTAYDLNLITLVHQYLREVDHRASLRYETGIKMASISERQAEMILKILKDLEGIYEIDDVMRMDIMLKYVDKIYQNKKEKEKRDGA